MKNTNCEEQLSQKLHLDQSFLSRYVTAKLGNWNFSNGPQKKIIYFYSPKCFFFSVFLSLFLALLKAYMFDLNCCCCGLAAWVHCTGCIALLHQITRRLLQKCDASCNECFQFKKYSFLSRYIVYNGSLCNYKNVEKTQRILSIFFNASSFFLDLNSLLNF